MSQHKKKTQPTYKSFANQHEHTSQQRITYSSDRSQKTMLYTSGSSWLEIVVDTL